ncbi:hypothetical protein M378DRAFT_18876 [Amanita muscaria Koide BX008]|uniref:Uncharacterized protein n=1 Tax=Amanita muscaria (strain Koide BX008) TaxID=946122 RepID=A0A0C2WCZ8_AMAMK|nr:hypothetical protein M378DRAFT_18876 [Amanita muscaria Koide BX008]
MLWRVVEDHMRMILGAAHGIRYRGRAHEHRGPKKVRKGDMNRLEMVWTTKPARVYENGGL